MLYKELFASFQELIKAVVLFYPQEYFPPEEIKQIKKTLQSIIESTILLNKAVQNQEKWYSPVALNRDPLLGFYEVLDPLLKNNPPKRQLLEETKWHISHLFFTENLRKHRIQAALTLCTLAEKKEIQILFDNAEKNIYKIDLKALSGYFEALCLRLRDEDENSLKVMQEDYRFQQLFYLSHSVRFLEVLRRNNPISSYEVENIIILFKPFIQEKNAFIIRSNLLLTELKKVESGSLASAILERQRDFFLETKKLLSQLLFERVVAEKRREVLELLKPLCENELSQMFFLQLPQLIRSVSSLAEAGAKCTDVLKFISLILCFLYRLQVPQREGELLRSLNSTDISTLCGMMFELNHFLDDSKKLLVTESAKEAFQQIRSFYKVQISPLALAYSKIESQKTSIQEFIRLDLAMLGECLTIIPQDITLKGDETARLCST